MKNLWNDNLAPAGDLNLRVYTSRLLGIDPSLVLHGGGNTSVKSTRTNVFGEQQKILYIKGSGCDLKTIEPQNFAPLDLNHLLKLAELETLSDIDMVRELRCAMTDPTAPNASIETIVHASIPCNFVDHTHADAVVTLSNTPNGEQTLKQLYGDRVLILPFAKPGFVLAQQIHQAIKNIDITTIEGIVLLNHGIFTFADDAKSAYETMIKLVGEAEDYIKNQNAWQVSTLNEVEHFDPLNISKMRKQLSELHGSPMIVKWHNDAEAVGFSALKNLSTVANQGPITPDHVIQTKPVPMIIEGSIEDSIAEFEANYRQYFEANAREEHTLLDCAPRVAIAPNQGIFTMAANAKRCNAVADIYRQTMKAIQWAENLSSWQPLEADILFEMEYWSLEQTKLKSTKAKPEFEGKIAFVTGAASGIGKSTVIDLLARGACVIATDISPTVVDMIDDPAFLGVICDVSSSESVEAAFTTAVQHFGGIDIIVSNAGTFPASALVEDLAEDAWQQSMNINLSGHYRVIKSATPYLKQAIDPSIVIIASKNVLAPGPGAAAYSCAKAGLTQLARVSALELAKFGIRVNVLHPNAVFDTGIWTDEVLKTRSENYGLSVEEYKKTNLLRTEITSHNVAELVASMCGSAFSKTTGAQVPIDGGNERVI